MNRRDLLKAGTFAGSAALAQDTLTAAQTAAAPPAQATKAAADAWQPEVLDPHQNQTVIALTDLIIPETDTPGAKAVNANRYIDLFLRDGRQEERENFLAGLALLDAASIKDHNHPFVRCTKDQQTALLTAFSNSTDMAQRRFFNQAKRMTATIYFNTAAGFRELNKNGKPATWGDPKHSAFACRG